MKTAYAGSLYYNYFPTVSLNGTEYRHFFTNWEVGSFGFAVWHEQRSNGGALTTELPEFVKTRAKATEIAQNHCEIFRKRVPPCTYHQVTVDKTEFTGSMMKEDYRTLRKWVLAQGVAQSDFVIAFSRDYYNLSFREKKSAVENIILFLKMNGLISNHGSGDLIVEYDGRLQDLPGYKP